MPPLITYLILVCIGAVAILALVDLVRAGTYSRFLFEVGFLAVAVVTLHITTNFPRPEARQPFGNGDSQALMIALMFLCILLGMASRYVFYLKGRFVWTSFLRPLCVSPIVLLPLLGTLQTPVAYEPIQVISFCILAFQNGFFWRVVFERAQTHLAN